MHVAHPGAGYSAWSAAYPEWIHVPGLGEYNGRYACPGEPEYEESLEKLRKLCDR
jgi:hypothetical protein